jgi:asparaginyl-tRNA synthetase
MSRIAISTLGQEHIDTTQTVWGWVATVRQQKKRVFLNLKDSYNGELQIVFDFSKFTEERIKDIQKFQLGWGLSVTGLFKKSPANGQLYELESTDFKIYGKVDDQASYPLAKTTLTMENIRQHPHIECRTKEKSSIYALRSAIKNSIDCYLLSQSYIETQMPSITHSECEGGCQAFRVTQLVESKKTSQIPTLLDKDGKTKTEDIDFTKDFFGGSSFLTVSAQLELETQLPLGNVYTWTKAFRGEMSMTTKHLAEFTMLEIEKLCESAKDIMDDTEKMIQFTVQRVLSTMIPLLKYCEGKFEPGLIVKLEKTHRVPFLRVSHAECISILKQQPPGKFKEIPEYDGDLATEHERFLADEHFMHPVFVTKYPKKIKSFYMPVVTETLEESHGIEHVDSFDLLIPGIGEVVGGSSRSIDADELLLRLKDFNIDPAPLDFYIDTRRKASLPHGGMGMGLERLVKYITGAPSVKDCVAFPRFPFSARVQ